MNQLKIAVVSPSGTFEQPKLDLALSKASACGFNLLAQSSKRAGKPSFLNGSKTERLDELVAVEELNADAIWCTRGGCGAIELWHDYQKEFYERMNAPLIGYSDISLYHFMRFYRASRIGVHGPVLFDLIAEKPAHVEALSLLLRKEAHNLTYPALKNLNHFLANRLVGELIPMNLISLQSIVGCFASDFFRGKILALEDTCEPHYKVFRALQQLKNAGVLIGLKALLLGYFGEERQTIIDETALPLADELGIPLFSWPIFGHDQPNWPLLFGASVTISKVDEQFFTLTYNEQHDHTPIAHEF